MTSSPLLRFAVLLACLGTSVFAAPVAPSPEPFGRMPDGTEVQVFTLSNARGTRLRAMTYGAIVVSLHTADREGKPGDIVLGYPTLSGYLKETPYFGAIVGRFGNRIAFGKFSLDGKSYTLATNNDPAGIPCSLHGGMRGFDKVVWEGEGVVRAGAQGVRFRYLSKDGEEGYPGNLRVTATYWLTEENEWQVEYEAETDRATPVNVTQHSYFNLRGEGDGDILGHRLRLVASRFTPVNAGLIPTGELRSVKNTPLDFTQFETIGARVGAQEEQLRLGGGYDHNWVLDSQDGRLALAAEVEEPVSGRRMEVYTTEPGIQFYCGNFLDGKIVGKSGRPYPQRSGFCLETQHYPDSPNQAAFPTCILRPGTVLTSRTHFRFSAK
ncbi:MAG: Aldose 1-epimerase precursor [Verrucomicrobiota bacterium]